MLLLYWHPSRIGTRAEAVLGLVTVIDPNIDPPPDLVIEVASSSLAKDKDENAYVTKRLGSKNIGLLI